MFTGIIEALGRVRGMRRKSGVNPLEIGDCSFQGVQLGESIAVNGVCLTVTKEDKGVLYFDVMPQTLNIANLRDLKVGEKVNLERALKVGDRLSGHFVTGHIDCQGIIRRKAYKNDNFVFEIAVPVKFAGNIVHRGSIAVDGISLTVADKKSNVFSVCIIPHTLKSTNLSFRSASDKVNIEFDILTRKI